MKSALFHNGLEFSSLRNAYDQGESSVQVLTDVVDRIEQSGDDHVWISRRTREQIMEDVAALPPNRDGIPFAVKDNMDVKGMSTTAACPEFSYRPIASAPMVHKLQAAGAILVGKTNMDQFATGLVGVRSPYGIPRNPFDVDMIPGGSSSGSAVAVGAGLVSFALGTDTGGSGRVPAAYNNIVGLKPTRGSISMSNVVPACRSLDCPAIFAHSVADAAEVADVMVGYDTNDPYSRRAPQGFEFQFQALLSLPFKFAIPAQKDLRFYGDTESEQAFTSAVARLIAMGGQAVEIDFEPLVAVGNLFYEVWLAERVADLGDFVFANEEAVNRQNRTLMEKAAKLDAAKVFKAQHQVAAVGHHIVSMWDQVDFLLVPTTGTLLTIDQALTEPVERNAQMGYYANFANMLDMAAIAVPNGVNAKGFPRGVTLLGPAWSDGLIAAYGASFVATKVEIG
jgi:allophanate hydrolase